MSPPEPTALPPVTLGRPIPRLLRPLREFLDTEIAGGIVLLAATVAALVWANSPWRGSYESLWTTPISVRAGEFGLAADLRHWINEGLMAIFFFVAGLEIKRELVWGELRDRGRAALPVIGAAGGMALPALVYAALNSGGPGVEGWGIPMPTDIAFALGALQLFGRCINPSARLFLLSLAIADDIGTIMMMALFYSVGIDVGFIAFAGLLLGAMVALRVLGLRWHPVFIVLGAGVWIATFASNASATLAGVAVAFVTPVRPLERRALLRLPHLVQLFGSDPSPSLLRETRQHAHAAVSVGEWLEHVLHPWASYGILPVFALANAGLFLGGGALGDALASPIAIGIVVGRVLGKPLGIIAAVWLACRSRVARLPEGVRWAEMGAVAVAAGVGFTVALVVTDLALAPDLHAAAKVGLLAATVLSALASWGALRASSRSS